MFRVVLLMVSAYTFGGESLDGYRPELIDQPLVAFHDSVNEAFYDGVEVLQVIDGLMPVNLLEQYMAAMEDVRT
ncbi:MAG: hypothetical protein AAFX39_11885 [Pseudomonadota bacterium]